VDFIKSEMHVKARYR